MTSVNTEITNMQNQTTANNLATQKRNPSTKTDDKNMFLNLMLQQLQNQDPTEPTSNTEWLSQLAQYSSLEQMTSMNEGLENCMNYIAALYNDMGSPGQLKIGDKTYSIANVISIRESDGSIKDPIIEEHTETASK